MSSNGNPLDVLRNHRSLLLACEAIGWLHMLGKAHPDFLRHHGGVRIAYDQHAWTAKLFPSLSDRLGWLRQQFPNCAWPSSLNDFVSRHAGRCAGLLGLLQAGHAMASGIEKQSYPDHTVAYLQQDNTHMWLVSPFGEPWRNLLVDRPEVLRQGAWDELLERVGTLLDKMAHLGRSNAGVDDWHGWREQAIGSGGWLRRALVQTLAETRLPNNDVTLWDQSYIAAALFKSAVAGGLLSSNFSWGRNGIKNQIRWRVLTIGFGTRHYEARAVRIGDWTGARREIGMFFDDLRRFIEVDIAIGSLVYQDDETLVFTFPGMGRTADTGLGDTRAKQIRDSIEEETDRLAQRYAFETPPLVRLSGSTRSFVPMVRERCEAAATVAVPVHKNWTVGKTENATAGHVCPVCGVRLNGNARDPSAPDSRQTPCEVCRERRRGRLESWLQGHETETIWLSEVADEHDHIALLTFHLGLDPWLEGGAVDSLRAQSLPEWRRSNPVLRSIDNPIDARSPYESLVQAIRGGVQVFDQNDPILGSLNAGYRHSGSWADFFAAVVEDRADAPEWDDLANDQRARWLAHQLLRKLPSPGRIHRFRREGEDFFEDLVRRFRDIAATRENGWRVRRIEFLAKDRVWKERETYAGQVRGAPFEILCLDPSERRFVTIANLARILKPEERAEKLTDLDPIIVRDDDGRPHELEIAAVIDQNRQRTPAVYHPVLTLERTAQRLRVLVPLRAVNACIEQAIAAWRRSFARVWDRLPLHVGVVAFDRKLPFQAVIEGARMLEARFEEARWERWVVLERDVRDGVVSLLFRREDGERELVSMPVRLPDGRMDVFYPYLRVLGDVCRAPHDFAHPAGQVYRHAADLLPGDEVVVDPGRFGMLLLDHAGRRFEPVTLRALSDFLRLRQAWRLLARYAPGPAALHDVWSELETTHARWTNPDSALPEDARTEWLDMVRTILRARLHLPNGVCELLTDGARRGLLFDALTWHLSWMRAEVGGEE
ncbi:MAG TPA: CRISPR-associated protein Csx11 [Planctomycetes bacterium]|nr:CRISPR-associated protein Csx11 [Planctomycetota bacterium]